MNKWIKCKTKAFLEKTGENVGDLRSGYTFLDITSEVWVMKTKVDKMDLLKVNKKIAL